MGRTLSRRRFVALSLGPALGRILGANDRIQLGLIGTGGRGQYNLGEIKKCVGANAEVTAVCDVWTPNRERVAAMSAEAWGKPPRQTADYRELLDWRDVDAVVISTPDFGHSKILEAAVRAGKDV